MRKKFYKIIFIVFVILGLFILSKIRHFVMMNHMYEAIENFRNEKNRYYAVETKQTQSLNCKREVFLKQNIFTYRRSIEDNERYCQWKNLETNEQYEINLEAKEIYSHDLSLYSEKFLPQMYHFEMETYEQNRINIRDIFKVRYIFPTKYENKNCYKIVTKTETILIDKETYLPVYSSTKIMNSSSEKSDMKQENKYEFKVGEVTDEDVALPDLTNYDEK